MELFGLGEPTMLVNWGLATLQIIQAQNKLARQHIGEVLFLVKVQGLRRH